MKTHFMFKRGLFPENFAIYEKMWKKCGTARQVTDDDIIRCMRFACWIAKAADTRLEYVIFNCVSMARMVSRMRFNVAFTRTFFW
jgi:hypothetical protein